MMTRSMTRRIAELEKEKEKLKECPCEAFEKLMIDNLAAQMMTCCARVHEHTRRLNTKPYYCDWCATLTTMTILFGVATTPVIRWCVDARDVVAIWHTMRAVKNVRNLPTRTARTRPMTTKSKTKLSKV